MLECYEKENLKKNIPWVEKYRPSEFVSIVLDPINRTFFKNIIEKNYFPNLLFYGPPGTGKTTTIMNIINEYQNLNQKKNKGMVIHLNASDERGIDIIRNQIYQFVKSNNFFDVGLKFVILDEVDYMTKNAQQALKFLLQNSFYNVRFCLICNYISKIDESLKNEFICVRFNQLPKEDIFNFIKVIAKNENLIIDDTIIESIHSIYKSDIRSMINYIQLNHNNTDWKSTIINNSIWNSIHDKLLQLDSIDNIRKYIQYISIHHNIDSKSIMKNYFNYIIRNKKEYVTSEFMNIVEVIIHIGENTSNHLTDYFIIYLQELYKKYLLEERIKN